MYGKKELDYLFQNEINNYGDGLELLQMDKDNKLGYYDIEKGYERIYYCPDTKNSLKERILMDKEVKLLINKDKLSEFLLTYLDENSLMVLNHTVFVWENEEKESEIRNELEKIYNDEYAQEIGMDMLGVTWVERQVIIINVSEILQTAIRIAEEPDEYHSIQEIFLQGLCSTIFHESRHLFYECNDLIPIGNGTKYPGYGFIERYVEDYGNSMANRYLNEFLPIISESILTDLIEQNQKTDEIELI